MSELGMRYEDARDMTVWEYNRKILGFRRGEDRDWHKIRVMASILLSPHLKKGKKIKPEDLIQLSDDVKVPVKSDEEKKADLQKAMKAYRNGKRKPFL